MLSEVCAAFLITAFLLQDFLPFLLHLIIDWLRLTGISGGHFLSSCSSKATCSRLPRTVSRYLLNIPRDRDSTASLDNLCPCLVTLSKKAFRGVQMEPSVFQFEPLSLVLSLMKRAWLCLCTFSLGIYVFIDEATPPILPPPPKKGAFFSRLNYLT